MPLSSLFWGKPVFFYLMGGIYLTETRIRHCPRLQIYLLHVIHACHHSLIHSLLSTTSIDRYIACGQIFVKVGLRL